MADAEVDLAQVSTTAGPAGRSRKLLMVEQGGRGGEADYTAGLTRAFAEQGWEVRVASAGDHRYPPTEGVTVYPVFRYVRGHTRLGRALRGKGLGRVGNGLRFVAALPRLVRLARGVDIVHVQGWEYAPLGLLAVFALRLTGHRVVQTWHNTFERRTERVRANRMLRLALAQLAARTIVHTRADLARVAPRVKRRAVVIPHGEYGGLARTGGSADRASARAELGIAPEAPVVMMFGQLRLDKGLDDLIAAVARVEGLHLIIAGEDIGALAAAADSLQSPELEGRVTVREGFLEMSDAARLFAATDTVALPYDVASQSGVLLLAYGFARPVVIYPVGGLVEAVLDGETGWVCERSDVAGLSDTLAATVAAGWPECRRRGIAGAKLAEERFGWPAIARRTAEVYGDVLGWLEYSERDELRSARLLLGSETAASVELSDEALRLPAVRAAVRSRAFARWDERFLQRVQRRLGRLEYEQSVLAPLQLARLAALGPQADCPPRFLVRVDEFPHYLAWGEDSYYNTERYRRFHSILAAAGVPYLVAALPRVSQAPLDPKDTRWRELVESERVLLRRLAEEGVAFALHGRDHHTRFRSPRRRSELCGLGPQDTETLLDEGLAELAEVGISPEVFVAPYNRFDASQYEILARRFTVVCGGPESVAFLGFQGTPMWRGEAVYMPSYFPLYGQAREILPAAQRLIDAQAGLWAPIALHWGWEADTDWIELERLVETIAPYTVRWQDFLAAVRESGDIA